MKKTWSVNFELDEKEYKEIDESLGIVYTFVMYGTDKGDAKESVKKLIKYFSGGDSK